MSAEKGRSISTASSSNAALGCKPFYLNVTLLNKDEVVANRVAEKAGKGIFGKAAAFAANKLISDDKIVENLSEKLITGVQNATLELGIQAEMTVKFQHGPFVVIKVQVADVDTLQLILSAKGPEFASNFTTLMETVTALGMRESVEQRIDERIYGSITDGMMNKFKEMIPRKMADQGVLVDCQVASKEDEAEVLFAIVASLKAAEEGK